MNIDYDAIIALAAIVASLTAICAVWIEGKRSRFSLGLESLIKLDEQFHSPSFTSKRRTLAGICLKDRNEDEHVKLQKQTLRDDILDFFETIGMLLQRGILDKELVYAYFYYLVSRYYALFKTDIHAVRKDDPPVWEELDWLYEQLSKLEHKYRPGIRDITPTRGDLDNFLMEELML